MPDSPLTSSQEILTNRFGAVYARPEYRGGQYLCFERDMRHYLTWGIRLTREQLVVMLELLAGLDFAAGEKDDFLRRIGSRALETNTGIARRNLVGTVKDLVGLGLLWIDDPGRPQTHDDAGKAATYDVRPLFASFEAWLDAGKPAAQPKARGKKAAVKEAA